MEEDSILYILSSSDAPKVEGGGEWEIDTGKILKGELFCQLTGRGAEMKEGPFCLLGE